MESHTYLDNIFICSHHIVSCNKLNIFYALNYFTTNPDKLIKAEEFVQKEIKHFVDSTLSEIVRDYNEASYLYPFWKNYPPKARGRKPRGDQFPWSEVGEKVLGAKLSRYFINQFQIRDIGLPSGSDYRFVISNEKIKEILDITDSLWIFIDIKSDGPNDNFPHVVLSPNQVSGSGNWNDTDAALTNNVIRACGERASHDFHCAMSPIYVEHEGTIIPSIHVVVKLSYIQLAKEDEGGGQPLDTIASVVIPNGILLTRAPNYLKDCKTLFYPGKDAKIKDVTKLRARVSFQILRALASWRVLEWQIH